MKLFSLLLLLQLFCISSFAERKYYWNIKPNSSIQYKGNTISFGPSDKLVIFGVARYSIPPPKALNGEKIFSSNESRLLSQPMLANSRKSFPDFVLEKLTPELSRLSNGKYSIALSNLVIDKTGHLVFFDFASIVRVSDDVLRI